MQSQSDRIPKHEDQSKGSQKDKDTTEGLVQRGQDIITKLSESLHNITSSLSHTASNLLHKVWHEDLPNPEKDLDPKIKENIKKINQEIISRPKRQERVIEGMGKGGLEGEKHSLLQKAREGLNEFSGKFTHNIENLEKEIPKKSEQLKFNKPAQKENISITQKGASFVEKAKEKISEVSEKFSGEVQSVETEEKEGRFIDLAPTEKINPTELREFHEVKTGFSETVEEFQHEKRIEEVGQSKIASSNPFDVLGNENLNLAQPLDRTEIVGGQLRTEGEKSASDITNQYLESTSGSQEGKPIPEKLREGTERLREGFSETTARIASKITETKEKIMHSLSHEKENVGTS